MQVKQGSIRPGAQLGVVVQEIAAKLAADDWMRCATPDDDSFYYIVGMKAHSDEHAGGPDHMSLSVPRGAPVSAFGEYQVHGQVVAPRSSDYYVRQAVSRLVNCGVGVDRELLSQFIAGDLPDLSFLRGHIGTPGTEGFQAFSDLLQAILLAKGMKPEATEAERRLELEIAVQKVYLREFSQLYARVVERASSLEVLDFSDPQLNEASRCYLYGFFRAAVMLAASALETNLRAALGPEGMEHVNQTLRSDVGRQRGFFKLLVDGADAQGLLGKRVRPGQEAALVAYSREIFTLRNAIVHEGDEPTPAVAEELLNKAREVVEFVRKRSGAQNPRHKA